MQRFFDVVLSGCALLLLSPLILPIALILRFTGEREVLYIQKRMGIGGKEFGIYKFATMLKNSPTMGAGTVTVRDDPRILPIGAFLRTTKINELPQLINIFVGDMSIVGPRPLVRKGFDAYDKKTQVLISAQRPGLSGMGSLVFRNEERLLHQASDPLKFYYGTVAPFKGQLEAWYAAHASMALYVKVIALTVLLIARPDSKRVYVWFPDLPKPPADLGALLFKAEHE